MSRLRNYALARGRGLAGSAAPDKAPAGTAALRRPAGYVPPQGRLPWFNPLNLTVVPHLVNEPCLNVLVPSLAMRSMSGGPNTALEIAGRLALSGVRVRLISADLPFDADTFDLAWTQHVAMNIEDRATLYREAFRVLRAGGRFAMFDVVAASGAVKDVKFFRLLSQDEVVAVRKKAVELRKAYQPPSK